jgi:hypothetical protein
MRKLVFIIIFLFTCSIFYCQSTKVLSPGIYKIESGTNLFVTPSFSIVRTYCPSGTNVEIIRYSHVKDIYAANYNGQFGYIDGLALNPNPGASISLEDKIKSEVEFELRKWLQKGEFEKSDTYKQRISKSNQDRKIKEITQQIIRREETSYIARLKEYKPNLEIYDADNETFKIKYGNKHEIILSVPIQDAPAFKENFSNVKIDNFQLILSNNEWIIYHLTAKNPSINKTYAYDIENQPVYSSVNRFELDISDIDIEIPETDISPNQTATVSKEKIYIGKPDVDINIPFTKGLVKNETYCLIIGNQDYASFQKEIKSETNVPYAINDAKIFHEYAIKTFGIPEENITTLFNATASQMFQAIDRMNLLLKYRNGNGELVFYYAGHGLPNEITKEPYLIPVDVNSSNLSYALSLQKVLDKLTESPAKKVTVFIDACFSGGARNLSLNSTRGVSITPKFGVLKGNTILFTSSSETQTSGAYEEKQHGVFTYFLLKKIQESSGDVTYQELANYLSSTLPTQSILINNKLQIPQILHSVEMNDDWHKWKLK